MASRITDNIIKDYAERNNFPRLYDEYKAVKDKKGLEAFKKANRQPLAAIEQEQKSARRAEKIAELREKDPTYGEEFGVTDEDIVEIFPEEFTKIATEPMTVEFGMPSDLFVPKGDMTDREWLNVEREIFRNAGFDFDNLEDRRAAAKAQSEREGSEALAEEATKESLGGWVTPRSQGKMERGEPVTEADAFADLLRIGEAAPPWVAVPAIAGRNILESYLDDDFSNAPKDFFGDIAGYLGTSYVGGRGAELARPFFRKLTGGIRSGEKALQEAFRGKDVGSRSQVAKATKDALLGKPTAPTNPYKEKAVEIVGNADLTPAQKKRAVGVIDKYLKDRDIAKVEKQAKTAMEHNLASPKKIEQQIRKEAKNIGKELIDDTKTNKLTWENISEYLDADDKEKLLIALQSQGLRGKGVEVNGVEVFEPSYVGVTDYPIVAKESGRNARESQVIRRFLNSNKSKFGDMFAGAAQDRVGRTLGVAPDKKLRGIFDFISSAPVAYEKAPSREALLYGVSVVPQTAGRRFARPFADWLFGGEDEPKEDK